MGFIRFLLWTSMCIGLGIFVASYEVDGRTPAQHFKQIWKGVPDARKLAAPIMPLVGKAPTETHSDSDRAAIDRLVAKRK